VFLTCLLAVLKAEVAAISEKFVLWFDEIGRGDTASVGGKCASLGEMNNKVNVPVLPGFAITAGAYHHFIEHAGLKSFVRNTLSGLDTHNMRDLARRGKLIRKRISSAPMSPELQSAIFSAYKRLGEKLHQRNPYVAVRSSATAEDLPDASFAGQQETYLNVRGEKALTKNVKRCFASLFTNRAISYRVDKGFDHFKIGLSVGIQKMGRSDIGAAGVVFTLDPDTGFEKVVVINGSYGLGEYVVQGTVIPDEFVIFKPTMSIIEKRLGVKRVKLVRGKLRNVESRVPEHDMERFCIDDRHVLELARHAVTIEKHYGKPMDIEWVLDGELNKLFIVQARPETVHSTANKNVFKEYVLKEKGKVMLKGMAVGTRIGQGPANVLRSAKDIHKFRKGDVLVTDMTDPDWEPIMKIASAIITNKGGRTCFAGDTKVLTNKGFLTMKELHERHDKNLLIFSYNPEEGKPEWKRIKQTAKNRLNAVRIGVSQTGRMKGNTVVLTPDHKMYTYDNRSMIKKPVKDIISDNQSLCIVDKLPYTPSQIDNNKLAYLLGALATDGHIEIRYGKTKARRGAVIFTQKDTEVKKEFIDTVNSYFADIFGRQMTSRIKETNCYLRGRLIQGYATDYRCYSLDAALQLTRSMENLPDISMCFSEESALNFLAGVIDGDGSFYNNRINIYVSKEKVLQSILLCCWKLGIVPQVTSNRTIHNIQILERLDDILSMTKRVKGPSRQKVMGTKLFAAKQLFSDIIDDVNYKGRIKPYVNGNLLIDARKIEKHILPMAGNKERSQISRVINSSIRMARVNFLENVGETDVYNIEVEAENELDHCYVVFTERYTPLLVSNSHAAIVSRELGVPCVIGTHDATSVLRSGQSVTVDCSTGEGRVYSGLLRFHVIERDISKFPKTRTEIMVNVGEPDEVFSLAKLPVAGVGLAREEFIITSYIGEHPLHMLETHQAEKFITTLAMGIGKIAAAFYPRPVIVRLSDFKTNEYATLKGGEKFEPKEENPMIGWRGASRYYDPGYVDGFELECKALKIVRNEMGLTNVIVMVPFCRTVEEGKKVLAEAEKFGLSRKGGCKFFVMAEIPSNVILAHEFSRIFDGFSIGSNDLTQLTLGIDRDSEKLSKIFDERNAAVKNLISDLIKKAHSHKPRRKVGICGQAPSDYPEFCEFLVKEGIDSISVNPDVAIKTIMLVGETEKKLRRK